MATQTVPLISPDEYLAMERVAEIKHEYISGQIFAMSGASYEHNQITANLARALGNQLEGDDCDVLGSDMRVKVQGTTMFTYPDLVVVCGQPHFLDKEFDTLLNPYILVEVLSPSTEAYDRGEKFAHYRTIPTLRHYLLVSQTRQRIEHYARQPDESWTLHIAERPDAAVTLILNKLRLDLSAVYRRVNVPLFEISENGEGRGEIG
jgi:Uma2 family endonuclease